MTFNSLYFAIFFLGVYACYLLLRNRFRIQNVILLIASYVFYGYWDWRFLILIAASTITDYFVGRQLSETEDITSSGRRKRKILLTISIAINLSILGFFKYFNFFSASSVQLLNNIGFHPDIITLEIILPVGISFYTFQTMSYSIDVYRGNLKATTNFLNFALFVAYFPQLVAGPIERASNMLPQFDNERKIRADQIQTGFFLIIWGYFKKVFVADNAALIANDVFGNYERYTGLTLLIGILAFSIQIYGDFSGYSSIARGISRLMGIELMVNFKLPYLAISPRDFWQRWHVSLSTWLRDYLYIPLGGNRKGTTKTYRNILVTMTLGGLWHGAAWNFVIWGIYHGCLLILERIVGSRLRLPMLNSSLLRYPSLTVKILLMFTLTSVGWVLFRSSSLEQAIYILTNVSFRVSSISLIFMSRLIAVSLPLIAADAVQHLTQDLLIVPKARPASQILIYTALLLILFLMGVRESIEFIYFQF